MAKDITIKDPQGTITYYPKTVSQLVYDNETDETYYSFCRSYEFCGNKGIRFFSNI